MASLIARAAEAIDRSIGWSRLPKLLALPVLIGLRTRLRQKNLHDTGRGAAQQSRRSRIQPGPTTSARGRSTGPTTISTTR